ncbi:MAG: hypothetical protein KatS3mg115_0859 [Candidatus Poribacteria bacterium]|nr:MAG: hypothetical protein KatS3mg115_0859 [Candidatus Poribacteria bacterium]
MPPTREGEYRAVGVCVDITDLKELEAELEQSRQRLEEILATIRDSFWSHPVGDGDEEIFLTDGVERLFGIPKEEAQRSRTALYRFIHPEDVHNLREKLYRRTPDGTNEYEFRIVRTDGEVRWVRARTYAQCDAEGNLTRVAGLAWDITEERRTRQALQLQIERQRTILEIAQLVLSNADAEVLLDRTAELLGKLTGAGYVGICEENAATGQGTVQAVYIHPETYEKGEAAWYPGTGSRMGGPQRGRDTPTPDRRRGVL